MANGNSSVTNGANTAPESCLLNKKIRLKPIIRTSAFTNNKSEATMLTGTSRSIICPTDFRTNRYVDPLTHKEKEYLEYCTGESFDVYRKEGCFWSNPKARIEFRKESPDINDVVVELNLNDPYDYAKYKLALIHPEVSNTVQDVYAASQTYFIDDEVQVVKSKSEFYALQDKFNEYRISIKTKKDKLYNFIRLYNFYNKKRSNIERTASIESMYTYISDLGSNPKEIENLANLVDKIKSDEASYELDLFILDAMQIGEVKKTATDFRLADDQTIGKSIDDVRYFFKDIGNQMSKLRITEAIKSQLK